MAEILLLRKGRSLLFAMCESLLKDLLKLYLEIENYSNIHFLDFFNLSHLLLLALELGQFTLSIKQFTLV